MGKKGFTLMEILIVVAVLALIGALVIILLNPLTQLEKAHDTKRKKDLNLLRKAIEEWYNDKGCYPRPVDICYTEPVNVCEDVPWGSKPIISQMCYICGNEEDSPSFSPYLERLPCDPLHPKYRYVYEVEAQPGFSCGDTDDTTHTCASWYRVYSSLFDTEDKDSYALGCVGQGCGFSTTQISPIITNFPEGYGFSYGISSSNTELNSSDLWFCQAGVSLCDSCGSSYEECLNNSKCNQWGNKIYPGLQTCQSNL